MHFNSDLKLVFHVNKIDKKVEKIIFSIFCHINNYKYVILVLGVL